MTQASANGGPATVPLAALGSREVIGSGAAGKIHLLHNTKLRSNPGPLVFKEYIGPAGSTAGLQRLVQSRAQLDDERRAVLDDMTAWPLRVVIRPDGDPAGVIMKLIPDEYMATMTMKFPPPATKRIVRELQHLIVDPRQSRSSNVDVPADNDRKQRERICERFTSLISMIHKLNLVYGDLSARNVLYRVKPDPSVFLVDCDAIRVKGEAGAVDQKDSPDWAPPEHHKQTGVVQTQPTDRYKVGLFVLRTLVPGAPSNTNPDAAAAVLDQLGVTMLRTALGPDATARTTAGDWARYFRRRLGP